MNDRLLAKAESVGALHAYQLVLGTIEGLVRTEIAGGMPNGTGYAEALQHVVDRLAVFVREETDKK